jgi:hypothetical protein
MTTRRKPLMGLHTVEERNLAYERAKEAYEAALRTPVGSVMRAYHSGYLQAIADMANDEHQEELANLILRLWVGAQELEA